ncbi:ABC transporter permease, partial [Leisingera sp. D0M16]
PSSGGGSSGFGGVFDPGNLSGGSEDGAETEQDPQGNSSGFGNVFDPNALTGGSDGSGSGN